MQIISLTKDQVALVDDDDFERLSQYEWAAIKSSTSHTYYATTYGGAGRALSMHRLIMDAPDGVQVDHKDGNGLNNTKANLRFATHAENMRNRRLSRSNKVGLKGVSRQKNAATFRAQIKFEGVRHHLGNFRDAQDAARAYNKAALRLHGEFARINILDD